jgi:hypothetical protein
MRRMLAAAALAALSIPAHAGESSTHLWFGDGVAWYEHPCGLRVFAKYGQTDTPEVRRAYEITKRDPTQCSRLFP